MITDVKRNEERGKEGEWRERGRRKKGQKEYIKFYMKEGIEKVNR